MPGEIKIEAGFAFGHDRGTESFANLVERRCDGCGNVRSVWGITDSEWEYKGTHLCATCLRTLLDSLVAQMLDSPDKQPADDEWK